MIPFINIPTKHPKSIKEHPPNFNICWKILSGCHNFLSCHVQKEPPYTMRLILVSSDHIICCHFSILQLILSFANFNFFILWTGVSSGFLIFVFVVMSNFSRSDEQCHWRHLFYNHLLDIYWPKGIFYSSSVN